MKLIATTATFNEHLRQANTILSNRSNFPRSMFSASPISYAFFDYGYMTSKELFHSMRYLCGINGDRGFVFIMLKPDSVNYFCRHFGWLLAASVGLSKNEEDDLVKFLTRDPGNSPADAIAYRADEIVMISDMLSSVAYGSRLNFELAIETNGAAP